MGDAAVEAAAPAAAPDATTGHGADFAKACRVFGSKIGSGGYGEVWLGQNTKTAQWVAIKIVQNKKQQAGGPSDETLREYETLVQLQHPNIVATYAFTYDRVVRTSSIYMELVSQGSLSDVIRKRYPPPAGMPHALVCKYAGDVLEGLSFAHSKGLIHRDIKPANMLVSVSGSLKIADFGLCKSIHDQKPAGEGGGSVTVGGTAQYMSPAAARGLYNVRSDIWAVGCSLVEMKSGVPPYQGMHFENGHTGRVQLLYSVATQGLRPSMPERTCETFRSLINLCLVQPEDPRTIDCDTLKQHPFILGEGIPEEDGMSAYPMPQHNAPPGGGNNMRMGRNISPNSGGGGGGGGASKPPAKHVDVHIYNAISLASDSEPISMSGLITSFIDLSNHPSPDATSAYERTSIGITTFLEWIASEESRDIKNIEEPDTVVLEILEQAAPQLHELLECRAYKGGSMLKAALTSAVRYIAVLFCCCPSTKRPFYEGEDCRENMRASLALANKMLGRVTSLLAHETSNLPEFGSLNGFEFILRVLKSGLELSEQANKGGVPCTAVANQCEASEVLLRYPLPYDDEVVATLNRYRFINDTRDVHNLFTVCFKLLTPVPMEHIQHHAHLSDELFVFTRMESYDWVVATAAIEHLLQLMLGATKVDGYRTTLPEAKQESLAYSVSDLYFGAAHGSTREGVGIRSFLTHKDVVDKGSWRVREKAAQAALTFYFSQNFSSPSSADNTREEDLDVAAVVAKDTAAGNLGCGGGRALTRSSTGIPPIPPIVVQDITSRLLPLVFTDTDARVVDSVNDIQQWLVYQPLFDWTLLDRIPYDIDNTSRILLIAKENCELTDFLDWKKNIFSAFCPDDIGAAIFRGSQAIPWVEFFNRLALFPPYNQRPNYVTMHSYLFPLIRYLMQCEDVYQTGSLNPPQDQVDYVQHFLPFQQYFPMQSMIPDLVWLDERRHFHLGAGTRESESIMRGQPKGSFLVRPAKSSPGKLALTAVAASRTGTKTTHKLIVQRETVDHLVIDGFPITEQKSNKVIRGLRELMEWLSRVAPSDFSTGVGTSLKATVS